MVIASMTALVLSVAVGLPPEACRTDGLTVHEWGTFTSFSGPEGAGAGYERGIADNLPRFDAAAEFGKSAVRVAHRMEMPAMYFHSPKETQVAVEVRLPAGMLTEMYPPVSGVSASNLDARKVPPGWTALRWADVRVAPEACCDVLALPEAKDSQCAKTRETRGDVVHVKDGSTNQAERFLSYRGVGNLDLGLRVMPLGMDQFKYESRSSAPSPRVFAVERVDGQIRFREYFNVKPGTELSLPKETSTEAQLETAVVSALTEAGLEADEAKMMVATRKEGWFAAEGTRLLVLLPQEVVDDALPLTVTPSPAKTTRVFVSRMEVLTPERMRALADVIQREETPEFGREAKEKEYRKLGEFRHEALQMTRDVLAARVDGC